MIRSVVFVVLMMFWLFFGCYVGYSPDKPYLLGTTLVPWLCVAILGYERYKGAP